MRQDARDHELTAATLHLCLADPALESMNFLNEVASRYPDAVSFASGRPSEEFFDVALIHGYLDAYCGYLRDEFGYGEARGEWVFQTDSDGEMSPVHFEVLWNPRRDFDFLVGYREHRQSAAARRLVTAASRLAVKLLFGHSVRDVNSPYRLMRRTSLTKMLRCLPPTTFAPNVALAGLAGRMKLRLYDVPVPHSGHRTVTAALNKWKLWKTALRCFRQTASVAFTAWRVARLS